MASESPYLMKKRSSSFQFEIDCFKEKNLPIGESISSSIFVADGFDWSLRYYPKGKTPANKGIYVSLYLCLESEAEGIVNVNYTFALLHENGEFVDIRSDIIKSFAGYDSWGFGGFIPRKVVKDFYHENGILVISCNISVLTGQKNVESDDPGGLYEHIEKLWEKGERFDVTFEVEGERISAHRLMLAARSPVFETQLFGPMAEANMECIKIDEMKPEVFKSLLRFIYTDSLANDDCSDDEALSVELLQDLLAAADRYSLEKLALLCEKQLEKKLSVDTVVATLFLAVQHSRPRLKQKCLEFASSPDNFSKVALTEGYFSILPRASSLLVELREEVERSSHSAKKLRTE